MKYSRLNFILIFIFLFGAAIIGRLVFLQVVNKSFYRALAEGQYGFFQKIEPRRGEIFLQNKEGNLLPVAISRKKYYVFLSPRKINSLEVDKKNEQVIKLANILNLEKNFILEKVKENENSNFLLLKDRLVFEQVEMIKGLRIRGIYLGKNFARDYPKNSLASHVLGFVGGEQIGQYGVEGYYEDKLHGRRQGFLKGTRDLRGHLVFFNLRGVLPPEDGLDLILTIDYNIQLQAERLLKEAKEKLEIRSGTIIVMEPNSGRILSLANLPDFNPNQFFKEENLKNFKNSAIQKIFEPGSVFKPIIIAAALDQEKITPNTTFIDEGMIKIGNHIIRNFARRTWGERTMTEVLENSINTGTVFISQQVGSALFLEYLERFGFFEPTGIDLQGEISFHNRELRKGREINIATASFGQGISITPIQLIRAFAIIANQGESLNPHVLENRIHQKPSQKIISQKAASQLTEMLVSAVEHPFRRRAQISGYHVAGKTGTAQVPWAALGYDRAGYSDEHIHTFVGFAPAFNPRFVILVKLNNPQGVRTASLSAAPIFRELGQYIVDYFQIPPDYIK